MYFGNFKKASLLIVGKFRLQLIRYMRDFGLFCFYRNGYFRAFVTLPKE